MQVANCIQCKEFPCADVRHECFAVPDLDVNPKKISIVMIAEAAPATRADYFYAGAKALFAQTTILAFNEAGEKVRSVRDIVARGVYLTTAVKCGKTGYGVETGTVKQCSSLLEQELALFPNVKALLLMGDVAIKAINAIAGRAGAERVIPAGSTYKIRRHKYFFRGMRAFPSYLQAGPGYFIEKSKRKMIAEDIASAIRLR